MNNFLLTSPLLWVYPLFANTNYWHGFSSLLHKRTPPLSGFFIFMSVIIYLPFGFFWADILGSLRARWSCVQSANPIYSPSRASHGSGLSNREQRSINHDIS